MDNINPTTQQNGSIKTPDTIKNIDLQNSDHPANDGQVLISWTYKGIEKSRFFHKDLLFRELNKLLSQF